MVRLKTLGFLFITFIGFVIVSANMGWDFFFFRMVKTLPFGDKISHFLLLGFTSVFVNLILNFKKVDFLGTFVFIGSAVVWTLITLEEFSQLYISTRTFDFIDLISNYIGIISADRLLYFWLSGSRLKKEFNQT
ncbi:MAG: hypothetical protein MRY83_16540 [Flavobacteriales bacterium]|nr:hypothetical protein [Flavobacteriales bacterium]